MCEQSFVTIHLRKIEATRDDTQDWKDRKGEVEAQMWVGGHQCTSPPSNETLRWDNEDGSARSHSTLAQSQVDPKVSTS